MKTIGIKLADGSFYPVLEEGKPVEKSLDLTTAHNNQTKVMVDLYRSETCSMDDAEYVDSLQIDNLIEHPNGEPNLSFTVAIDENNKLSAKMVDPETGLESDTNITLVSRTIEERLQPDEYNISDTIDGATLSPESNTDQNIDDNLGDRPVIDSTSLDDFNIDSPTFDDIPEESEQVMEETAVEEPALENESNVSLEETVSDQPETTISENEDKNSEGLLDAALGVAAGIGLAEAVHEVNDNDDSNNEIPNESEAEDLTTKSESTEEFNLEDTLADISNTTEETAESPDFSDTNNTDIDMTNLISDSGDSPIDETISSEDFKIEDNISEEPDTTDISTESSAEDFKIDDIFTDSTETSDNNSAEIAGDDDVAGDSQSSETTEQNTEVQEDFSSESTDLPDMNFDLPENSDNGDTPLSEDSSENTLPDMNFDLPEPETSNSDLDSILSDDFSLEQKTEDNEENNIVEENSDLPDMNFDLPENSDSGDSPLDTSIDNFDNDSSLDDDLFNSDSSDDSPAAAGPISFTGLYDKETEFGDSSIHDNDETKNKTKVPVIICTVCAAICVVATLVVLFLVPGKAKNKKAKNMAETQPVVEEQKADSVSEINTPSVEEIVPESKEEEVIVIEKAEDVVPAQPPAPVVKETPKTASYKIKWGDTLWDIANTYYKNPWKYKYIARYNGIKDPDYIISGTYIIIPQE